ncbi:MAG: 50S ribosomal protein L16 [Mesoaciditoga sp.]|uniref:50S ribosomal protein L16 n=1 Tax=Athalassotoga TaxID=1769718 RepID=UPI000CB96D40|nr:50S ribosomal protein L16 [Athalassotoga saccharophila]PMP69904.1 MAG: 50S ribosomal protein L16 [Mesoaciditoga sp.]PMP79902.1 MAG: 50S ribosomal protein L16 [Mesoaciditoga sp.]BBJ27225.1 50S ribosomal protein L16 [Athalassotoga saccharophila]HEU23696.1 50S ribosomal protein L16 [Mesoaciditoga lauensis]
MLIPKRVKYRKQQRGRMRGFAKGGTEINFGEWGLKALEPAWITNKQIEACRVAIMRSLKKSGMLWIKIFPDKPVSVHPAESRMGRGKGNPEKWVCVVKPGKIMFEIGGVNKEVAEEALRLASSKLPIKTKIVQRTSFGGESL